MVLAPSQIQPLSSRNVPAKRATEGAQGASLRQAPETAVEELIEVLRERGAAHHDRIVDVKILRMDPDDGSLRVDGDLLTRMLAFAHGKRGGGMPGNPVRDALLVGIVRMMPDYHPCVVIAVYQAVAIQGFPATIYFSTGASDADAARLRADGFKVTERPGLGYYIDDPGRVSAKRWRDA